ncbi:MAG: hypothetical protein ACREAK_11580 [Nitrosarchaeum sp.]
MDLKRIVLLGKDVNNSNKLKKYKHILVNEYTYEKLRSLGKTGDSFNEVISKLLEKEV